MQTAERRLFGKIVPKEQGLRIDREFWIRLIDQHPNLCRRPSSKMINPFTGESESVLPPRDSAVLMMEGMEVGEMYWFMNEENGIWMWVNKGSEGALQIGFAIAGSLNAQFLPE